MAISASGQGGIVVRVDPAQSDLLVASTKAVSLRARPGDTGIARRWRRESRHR
jgi:hypothetical protein